jgi:SnoaL-like domain
VDDIEAIKQLKARYFRLMDAKDFAAMRAVFADDAYVDVTDEGGGIYESADAFFAMLEPTLRGIVTAHHGHMPEIELTSPTTATGIWAMEDRLWFPPGGRVTEMHGYGHYHETYVKLDGTWRIQTMKLVRLRVDFT